MKETTEQISRQNLVEQVMYKIIGQLHFTGLFTTDGIDSVIVSEAIGKGFELEYLISSDEDDIPFMVSQDGIDSYIDAISRTSFLCGADTEFRREALSGVDFRGKKSEIKNAALPSHEKRYDTDRDRVMVSIVDEFKELEKFAKITGETESTLREGMESGRIGVCRHGGRPHWGKFHSDGKNRGFRTVCTNCTKGNRS